MISSNCFCALRCKVREGGCDPDAPALPPPSKDGSNTTELSCRESKDRDGRVDWENGVVGDERLAEVLAAPFVVDSAFVRFDGG